jgi:cytosine/adenosine deaminase-related metal-dependent hydrolase
MPNIDLLRRYNANITIGTDSLASNHQLSILDELKTITAFFPEIQLEELLQWATLNGAKALLQDHQFGSFENGKRPGVILISKLNGEAINDTSTINRLI